MVGGMCSLLPYGTGICHYTFILHFLGFDCWCPFIFDIFLLSGIVKSDGMVNETSMC